MTLQDKINVFLKENGFPDDGGSSEKIAWFKMGFISVPLPNLKTRRDHIYVHDVSHIVTGYDTSWKGESAVSAWEIASGGWKNYWILWIFTMLGFAVGVLFFNSSTRKAFERGKRMFNGMTKGWSKKEVLSSEYSEIELNFTRKEPTKMSFGLWAALSVSLMLSPLLIGVLVWVICF